MELQVVWNEVLNELLNRGRVGREMETVGDDK